MTIEDNTVDGWVSLDAWSKARQEKEKMSTAEKIEKMLEVYEGAENCAENRAKMKTLILEELPYLTEEDLDTAIDGILGDE